MQAPEHFGDTVVETDGCWYFKDGTRVQLEPHDYRDGCGPVEETGTVIHDLGGDGVPVYIDGKNDPTMPHDYTNVPRGNISRAWNER